MEERRYRNHKTGVWLEPEEAKILRDELHSRGIGIRVLSKELNTYLSHVDRWLHCEAAVSPKYSIRTYEFLGKHPSVKFLVERAKTPAYRRKITQYDHWAIIYDNYSRDLRRMYLDVQNVKQKVILLQDLEALVKKYARK